MRLEKMELSWIVAGRRSVQLPITLQTKIVQVTRNFQIEAVDLGQLATHCRLYK